MTTANASEPQVSALAFHWLRRRRAKIFPHVYHGIIFRRWNTEARNPQSTVLVALGTVVAIRPPRHILGFSRRFAGISCGTSSPFFNIHQRTKIHRPMCSGWLRRSPHLGLVHPANRPHTTNTIECDHLRIQPPHE